MKENFDDVFTRDALDRLFPATRADEFFEALLGDAAEGAYDIGLAFKGYEPEERRLNFEVQLRERPGKCLACNVTYGLPQVFSRHPVINIKGLVEDVERLLGDGVKCNGWSLHHTQTVARDLHVIPLTMTLEK